jgi:sugar lactone lactonase YvrE
LTTAGPLQNGVRVAVTSPALLGESPVWHPDEQVLYYCDIPQHRVLRFNPVTAELRHWQFDTDVASLAPMPGGFLLLAMRDGLWRFDPQTGHRTALAPPPYDPRVERFNDGKCDAQGRFWVGTYFEPHEAPVASLHCYAAGQLVRQRGDVMLWNGLAWSPDGSIIYWADSSAHTIYTAPFDSHTGHINNPRVFVSFSPPQPLRPYGGRPDGAAVDVEGCYWIAMFEGQRLLRFSPSGQLLREVILPTTCPTMPCFGGSDLKTIYLTTARYNRPADELRAQPHAGCVLALDVDVPGLPVHFVRPNS